MIDSFSFPLIHGSRYAGEPKHKFRFYHGDEVKGLEIPYIMWLDERMRVVTLEIDSERQVKALPGYGPEPVRRGGTVVVDQGGGKKMIIGVDQMDVEAVRLIDSTAPLLDHRQEKIRLTYLKELHESIEDPNCPSQQCMANGIRKKYRDMMKLTFGRD